MEVSATRQRKQIHTYPAETSITLHINEDRRYWQWSETDIWKSKDNEGMATAEHHDPKVVSCL